MFICLFFPHISQALYFCVDLLSYLCLNSCRFDLLFLRPFYFLLPFSGVVHTRQIVVGRYWKLCVVSTRRNKNKNRKGECPIFSCLHYFCKKNCSIRLLYTTVSFVLFSSLCHTGWWFWFFPSASPPFQESFDVQYHETAHSSRTRALLIFLEKI